MELFKKLPFKGEYGVFTGTATKRKSISILPLFDAQRVFIKATDKEPRLSGEKVSVFGDLRGKTVLARPKTEEKRQEIKGIHQKRQHRGHRRAYSEVDL